jgi:parallel beta-helix repeat protein
MILETIIILLLTGTVASTSIIDLNNGLSAEVNEKQPQSPMCQNGIEYKKISTCQSLKSVEAREADWNRTYGTGNDERAYSIIATSDGGYALAGTTGTFEKDFWFVKVDSVGNMEWNRTKSFYLANNAHSAVQTVDGGYVVAGYSLFYNNQDMVLIKYDSSGNYQWWNRYGGTNSEAAYSLVQTANGSLISAGHTKSYGAGWEDFYLVSTDSTGNFQWQQTYGGSGSDYAECVIQTSNGGYALCGITDSFGAGGYDFLLVKTDSDGNMEWNCSYGGVSDEWAYSLIQTADGGYVIAGYTFSNGAGASDVWLVKTDVSGNMVWNKTYGGMDHDFASCIVQTYDGGYAVAGSTESFGAGNNDFWVFKTDSAGNMVWNKTFGGSNVDVARSMIQTDDGGYAIAGGTSSFGAGREDFWLIKLATPTYIGDVYIRADGSIDPSEAPISSLDNVTYTVTGNINGSIIVERSNSLLDGDGYTLQGLGEDSSLGVWVYFHVNNVTIQNMNIEGFHGGIWLTDNSDCIVRENNVISNKFGVYIHHSLNGFFCDNNVENNGHGFYMQSTTLNNTLIRNNIESNEHGATIDSGCWYNRFYHNNFMNNSKVQAWSVWEGYVNYFDNGYPDGGNYWSDYAGVDEQSGPNQNQSGSDGLGDSPYIIDDSNVDHYPLMTSLGDLFTTSMRPIQVIAEPEALIANKSTAIQVDLLSTFYQCKKVIINVTYNFGTERYSETGRNGDGVTINPGLNRIYIPGGPTCQMQGEEWVVSEQAWSPLEEDDFFEWTSTGTDSSIESLVDPGDFIAETDETNNEMAVSKDIVESKSLRILVVPVYFPSIAQNPKVPSMNSQKEFLLGTYPIADNRLEWHMSSPMPFYETPPSADSFPAPLRFSEWLYKNVGIPITNLAKNLGYDRAVIVIHGLGQGKYWSGWAPGMLFRIPPQNRVPLFVDDAFLSLWDGSLVAHEIGHTYYLMHPHDTGPPVYDAWRFWVLKRSYEEYSRTFMSYSGKLPSSVPYSPVWIDKGRFDTDSKAYRGSFGFLTWNLFDQLTVAQTSVMVFSNDSEVIAISFYLFKNDTARIDSPWYRLSEGASDINLGSVGNYSIVLLNDLEQIVGRFGFNASFAVLHEINETLTLAETDCVTFAFNIPYIAGTKLIEIRNSTDHILASRVLTTNAPSVNITFPNGGETLIAGVDYTISWNGSDYDGDNITFTLAYSADAGKSWVPLLIESSQASHVWDTSKLKPGANYLIKVIATDGTNTCVDTSNSTFIVLDQTAPLINVFSPQNKTYNSGFIALTFEVNEPTSWIGYSLDSQANVTISGNTFINVEDEAHIVIVYANDTSGNMGSSKIVHFAVDSTYYDPWESSFIGLDGYPIIAFAVYNGRLYAAADSMLYVYDGSSWNIINVPTFVVSLEPYQDKLVVGGQGGLYSFDGTAFNLVFQVPTYVKVLGVYNNTLYAGTLLDKPPTLYYCNGSVDNPADWHVDTSFSSISNFSGPFGSIDSFEVCNNTMYVTSGNKVYSFNGTNWDIAKMYDDVYAFLDIEAYNGKLYLATRDSATRCPVYQGGSGFCGRVVEFDGDNWITVLDHDYWIYSLETYGDKLYAGTANKIFTYNGTDWETSFSSEEGAYYAISLITYDSKIYAGMGNGYIFEDPSPEALLNETVVVPEFQSFMILFILIPVTLLGAIITRKKDVRP